MMPRIHREGLPIVAVFVVVTALAWVLWVPLGGAGVVLTLWCLWFFRDPERTPPAGAGLILAPADGRLLPIVKAPPPEELLMGDKPLTRISIFMNVFNVHVNRIPADGKITAVHYRPGRFFNASFDKASIYNERLSARMMTDTGFDIAFVQIAGLIARRIRSQLSVDEKVTAGVRYGLIRFGSRVDIYLPDDIEPLVREGETMVAGVTVLAAPDSNLGQAHDDPAQNRGIQ
ncbi:MAG: phosphatidylserine decarboxylase [Alphaproteobacteria bacterium]|jgi:phosphatidylserine decarboxylase